MTLRTPLSRDRDEIERLRKEVSTLRKANSTKDTTIRFLLGQLETIEHMQDRAGIHAIRRLYPERDGRR